MILIRTRKAGGRGLANMRARASLIDARFHGTSVTAAGTVFTLDEKSHEHRALEFDFTELTLSGFAAFRAERLCLSVACPAS